MKNNGEQNEFLIKKILINIMMSSILIAMLVVVMKLVNQSNCAVNTLNDKFEKKLAEKEVKDAEEREYTELIKSAESFVKNGNIEEAVSEYNKAIALKPGDEKNYVALANIYFGQIDFEKAFEVLDAGIKNVEKNHEILVCREKIIKYQKKLEIVSKLYTDIQNRDFGSLNNYFDSSDESQNFNEYEIIYLQNGKLVDEISSGEGLIYDVGQDVYLGEMKDGKREGKGFQYGHFGQDLGEAAGHFYTIEGTWKDNSANGYCELYKSFFSHGTTRNGEEIIWQAIFKGNYNLGYEDGDIAVEVWHDDESDYGSGVIHSTNGARDYTEEDGKKIYLRTDNRFYWYSDDPKGRMPVVDYDNSWDIMPW